MMLPIVFADIGANAFWLLYLWLGSAIACSEIAKRKGYTEKAGLGTGLLLSAIGVIVWLLVPARPESRWTAKKRRDAGADADADAEQR